MSPKMSAKLPKKEQLFLIHEPELGIINKCSYK